MVEGGWCNFLQSVPYDLRSEKLKLISLNPLQSAIEIIPPGPLPLLPDDDDSDIVTVMNSTAEQCGHIATTYIIPDLLHLAAYLLGLWYFRYKENEQLYALMEKV